MRLRRLLSSLFLLCAIAASVSITGISPVSAQGTCPTPTYTGYEWPTNATIFYDNSGLNSTEQAAVVKALGEWNTANAGNGSGVSFSPKDSSHPATLVFSNNTNTPPPGGAACQPLPSNAAAGTCPNPTGSTLNSASVMFNLTGTIPNTNPPQPMYDQSNATGFSTAIQEYTLHEVGHTMGMGDQKAGCGATPNTVMNQGCGTNDSGGSIPTNVTSCNNSQETDNYVPPDFSDEPCQTNADCTCGGQCSKNGTCIYAYECTPILIAVGQTPAYDLTSPQTGVWFDLQGSGIKQHVAWTQAAEPVGFLVWDKNENGIIDNGSELFGNYSVLPNGQLAPNGFIALAAYDQLQNGGNGDGVIDANDAIWAKLRLWIDWNHNGISEPSEIYHLEDFGITQISLQYEVTNRTDQYGNVFHLQAPCQLEGKIRLGYDVYFTMRPPRKPTP